MTGNTHDLLAQRWLAQARAAQRRGRSPERILASTHLAMSSFLAEQIADMFIVGGGPREPIAALRHSMSVMLFAVAQFAETVADDVTLRDPYPGRPWPHGAALRVLKHAGRGEIDDIARELRSLLLLDDGGAALLRRSRVLIRR